jgi:predicted kinase
LRALELGSDVVIDFGLWTRNERAALRQAAADIGANVEVLYFEIRPREQQKRLHERLAERPRDTWPISNEELNEWAAKFEIPTAGEIDGSEPVGDPPEGFATWHEWMTYRWPPTLQKD